MSSRFDIKVNMDRLCLLSNHIICVPQVEGPQTHVQSGPKYPNLHGWKSCVEVNDVGDCDCLSIWE